jgi:hypothetical protein
MPLTDPVTTAAERPRPRLPVRPLDALIVALSAAALVALSITVYGGPAAAYLIVSSETGEWVYPLSQDREIEIEGPLGITRVHIEGGQARIEDSPCANRTCVASPAVSRRGDWSACLPNGVFIRVDASSEDDDVDATVR